MRTGTEVAVELEVRLCVRLQGKDVLVVTVEDTGRGERNGGTLGFGGARHHLCGPGLDSQSQGNNWADEPMPG